MEARKWNGSPCNITWSCQSHLHVKVLALPSSVSSCHPRESCGSSSPLNSTYNLEEESVFLEVPQGRGKSLPEVPKEGLVVGLWPRLSHRPIPEAISVDGNGINRTDHEAGDRANFSWGLVLEENTWTKSGLLGRRVGDQNSVRYTPCFIPGT